MKRNQQLPPGWTNDRVKKVIEFYDNQTEAEAIAEAEDVFGKDGYAVMEIPRNLVDKVRDMIAKARKAQLAKAT